MAKWKIVRNVTLIILVVFILFVVLLGLAFAFDNGVYPDDILGLTRLRAFKAVMTFVLLFSGIPVLTDILLLIISIMKLRKLKDNI